MNVAIAHRMDRTEDAEMTVKRKQTQSKAEGVARNGTTELRDDELDRAVGGLLPAVKRHNTFTTGETVVGIDFRP